MLRSPAPPLGRELAFLADASHRGGTHVQRLCPQQIRDVVVVELDHPGQQFHDHVAQHVREPPWRDPPAVAVDHSPDTPLPDLSPQPLELAPADAEGGGAFPIRQLPFRCGLNHTQPPGVALSHEDQFHGGAYSLTR